MEDYTFQNIALTGRDNLGKHKPYFQKLVKYLKKNKKTIYFDQNIAKILKVKATPYPKIKKTAGLILTFGGDGSLLGTVRRLYGAYGLFAGVRLDGTLGFLTEYAPDKLEALLKSFFSGKFATSERILIKAEVLRKGKVIKKMHALNEAALTQSKLARLIELDFSMNQKKIATFHADGAIIATPTGSTAYSLAAGGPIIDPSLHSFVLTPINPHLLANRPLVLPDDSEIEAKVQAPHVVLTSDGQTNFNLKPGDKITFRKANWRLRLIQPLNRNHFEILRKKLNWAERS